MTIRDLALFSHPTPVQRAIGFLLAAWLSLFAFIYHIQISFPGTINIHNIYRVVIVGVLICYFVIRIKPWARILCIFFNIGILGINLLFLFARISSLGLTSSALTFHALVNCILFAAAGYYLWVKETADFFRARAPQKPPANDPAGK
jgi:hypothetical protein